MNEQLFCSPSHLTVLPLSIKFLSTHHFFPAFNTPALPFFLHPAHPFPHLPFHSVPFHSFLLGAYQHCSHLPAFTRAVKVFAFQMRKKIYFSDMQINACKLCIYSGVLTQQWQQPETDVFRHSRRRPVENTSSPVWCRIGLLHSYKKEGVGPPASFLCLKGTVPQYTPEICSCHWNWERQIK